MNHEEVRLRRHAGVRVVVLLWFDDRTTQVVNEGYPRVKRLAIGRSSPLKPNRR